MDSTQVFELLAEHQNSRGIAHWQKMSNTGGLTSFGIGLTVLRRLAKQIGRDHERALKLWASDNYDARVLGLLTDEPKKITVEQAERQVEQLGYGMLSHVFATCDATLAKAPFVFELAQQWLASDDERRIQCGYGLVYELSKKKNRRYSDQFFLSVIRQIERDMPCSSKALRLAMGTALMGIGKRTAALNQAALVVARATGPIDFSEQGSRCDPLDVEKHLISDHLKQKLGL